MSSGISGPVIFNVKDGTYTEQLTIGSISGASTTNTITFQSLSNDSTKAILSYATNSSKGTVNLNNASYIYFKKLTIKTTSSGMVVYYYGGTNNITFFKLSFNWSSI